MAKVTRLKQEGKTWKIEISNMRFANLIFGYPLDQQDAKMIARTIEKKLLTRSVLCDVKIINE